MSQYAEINTDRQAVSCPGGVCLVAPHTMRVPQISRIGFQMTSGNLTCSRKRHITRQRDATSVHATPLTPAGLRLTCLSRASRGASSPRNKIGSLAARDAQVGQRCFGHLASTPAFKCLLHKPLFFPAGIGSPLCLKSISFRIFGRSFGSEFPVVPSS